MVTYHAIGFKVDKLRLINRLGDCMTHLDFLMIERDKLVGGDGMVRIWLEIVTANGLILNSTLKSSHVTERKLC